MVVRNRIWSFFEGEFEFLVYFLGSFKNMDWFISIRNKINYNCDVRVYRIFYLRIGGEVVFIIYL